MELLDGIIDDTRRVTMLEVNVARRIKWLGSSNGGPKSTGAKLFDTVREGRYSCFLCGQRATLSHRKAAPRVRDPGLHAWGPEVSWEVLAEADGGITRIWAS